MSEEKQSLHFIEQIIEDDLANGFSPPPFVSVSLQNRMATYT